MNSLIRNCPKCRNHFYLKLFKDKVNMQCNCGYNNVMTIASFLVLNNTVTHNSNAQSEANTFKEIINDIKNCYNHLNNYFQSVKTELISQLASLINEIELSYNESYNRNKNVLTFIQLLIDNYDGSKEMKSNIQNYKSFNIYKCRNTKSINEVIKYYNEYSILNEDLSRDDYIKEFELKIASKNGIKEIKTDELKVIKTISEHTSDGNSLLLLKNNKIASCFNDNTIQIFDPLNDYKCERVIKRQKNSIQSICQLSNGDIVSGSFDKSIVIGNYTINNAHDDQIRKVIILPNNRIASSSLDTKIKIWSSIPPYILIKQLTGHTKCVNSLLYLNDKDIMLSGSVDGILCFWNLKNYQCITIINTVFCSWVNSLYRIDKNRVIVSGKNQFTIVNIDKCAIENRVIDNSFGFVNCYLKLRDNKTILCGCDNLLCFYDINTQHYSMIQGDDKKGISDLLYIDENTFISCSFDKTIRIWKY